MEPEKLIGPTISFAGLIASAVSGYIAGTRAAARESGKREAEFDALKKSVEQRDEVIHNRVSKMQMETQVTLEKLDARSIELLERHAELKGIILGKGGLHER